MGRRECPGFDSNAPGASARAVDALRAVARYEASTNPELRKQRNGCYLLGAALASLVECIAICLTATAPFFPVLLTGAVAAMFARGFSRTRREVSSRTGGQVGSGLTFASRSPNDKAVHDSGTGADGLFLVEPHQRGRCDDQPDRNQLCVAGGAQ
jgi:hypothetical protein